MPQLDPSGTTPPAVQAASLANQQGISHGFFGREGGVSKGVYTSLNVGIGSDDDPNAVATNRQRVAAAIGAADSAHLQSCYQIHSANVIGLDGSRFTRPEGDGMVTVTPGLALCILTADCTPVLFADPEAQIIGAAHAGWKGAIGGVCEATIDAMVALGADADRIIAAIGPTIQQASYEVGPEFRDRFVGEAGWSERFFIAGQGDRLQFDLPGFVEERLVQAGLKQIDLIPHDTCARDQQYFSNRRRHHRGEADYGRNASVIMLTGK
ncbi:MAG: peptidoglycan editing factor PgeF [Pseudomonadota bacterium]